VSASGESETIERQALLRLESAVGRLLSELEALRARSERAEVRVTEVETLLRRFTKGDVDPADLERASRQLVAENAELRERIEESREGVDRLLARIRFMEEQS
jgi:predicted RNase H-like nuclease (RuvC/YqgF family)